MLTLEEKRLNLTIDSDALNGCILKMEDEKKKIEELFTKIENDFKSFHENDIWSGDANQAYFDRFLKLQEFFPKVNTNVLIFLNTFISISISFNIYCLI